MHHSVAVPVRIAAGHTPCSHREAHGNQHCKAHGDQHCKADGYCRGIRCTYPNRDL